MSGWLSDLSANKFKNTYFSDINASGRALDISGNIVIRSENSLKFENQELGSYIGKDASTNLLDGSTNIIVGNSIEINRLKQWELGNIATTAINDNSWNSIAYGNGNLVVVGDASDSGIIYSNDNGITWSNVANGSNGKFYEFSSYTNGVAKVRLYRSSNSGKRIGINELQIWVNNVNLALTSTIENSTEASGFAASNILDGNLFFRKELSDDEGYYKSSSTDLNQGFTIVLPNVVKYIDIQSIVIYNVFNNTDPNFSDFTDIDNNGVTMELIDEVDNVIYSNEITTNEEHYRFDGDASNSIIDGPVVSESDSIINFVGFDSATNVIDSTDYAKSWHNLAFNKVKLERHAYGQAATITNQISIDRLQVWKNKTEVGVSDRNDISFNLIYISSSSALSDNVNISIPSFFIALEKDGIHQLVESVVQATGNGFVKLELSSSSNPTTYSLANIKSIAIKALYRGSSTVGSVGNLYSDTVFNFCLDTDDNVVESFTFAFDDDGGGVTVNENFRIDGPKYDKIIRDESSGTITTAWLDYKRYLLSSRNMENVVNGANYNNVTTSAQTGTGETTTNGGAAITIDLLEDVSFNDLKSILIYPTTTSNLASQDAINAMKGVSVKLLKDNTVIYNYLISNTVNNNDVSNNLLSKNIVYRFNGASSLLYTDQSNESYENDDASFNTTAAYTNFRNIVGEKRILTDTKTFSVDITNTVNTRNLTQIIFDQWQPLKSIAYGNGRFVAIGERIILQTTDPTTTWQGASFNVVNDGKGEIWNKVIYDETKGFIVSSSNRNPRHNLTNWNNLANDWIEISGNDLLNSAVSWNSIAYGDKYVVVANANIAYFDTTWQYVIDLPPVNFVNVTYGVSKYVAVGNDNIYYSSDGINWINSVTIDGDPWASRHVQLQNNNWVSVKYISNYFVALSNTGVYRILYSYDAINWYSSSAQVSDWVDSTFDNSNNYFYAVANSQSTRLLSNIGKTVDSITLGNNAKAEYHNSVAIGRYTITTGENQIKLGGPEMQSVILPIGNTLQRPYGEHGMIRYNSQTERFEGYSGSNTWTQFGGNIIDVDRDTFITAETSETVDSDELTFFTDGVQRMVIDACGNVGIDVIPNVDVSGCLFVNAINPDSINSKLGLGVTDPSFTYHFHLNDVSNNDHKFVISYNTTTNPGPYTYDASNHEVGYPQLQNAPFQIKRNDYNTTGIALDIGHFQDTGDCYIQCDASGINARAIALNPYCGKVGVGTVKPRYHLDVVGKRQAYNQDGDTNYNETNLTAKLLDETGVVSAMQTISQGDSDEALRISIRANGALWCEEVLVSSDERIKTNIVDISNNDALNKLRLLQPKKYSYIDTDDKGNGEEYGFIAQEVEKVLNKSTSKTDEFIPNIYDGAVVLNGNVLSLINKTTNELNENDIIKIICKRQVLETEIQSIVNEKNFILKDKINNNDLNDSKVFVYGKKVNDFLTLEKNAIWTITTAALQQVDKELQEEKQKVEKLQEQLQKVVNILENLVPEKS